jgi:hypothetical protein
VHALPGRLAEDEAASPGDRGPGCDGGHGRSGGCASARTSFSGRVPDPAPSPRQRARGVAPQAAGTEQASSRAKPPSPRTSRLECKGTPPGADQSRDGPRQRQRPGGLQRKRRADRNSLPALQLRCAVVAAQRSGGALPDLQRARERVVPRPPRASSDSLTLRTSEFREERRRELRTHQRSEFCASEPRGPRRRLRRE